MIRDEIGVTITRSVAKQPKAIAIGLQISPNLEDLPRQNLWPADEE
jgi:hypothetical protein